MNIEIVAQCNSQSECTATPKVRLQKWFMVLAVAILSIQFSGCCNFPKANLFDGAFIDSAFSCYRDKVWAKRACNLRYSNCNRPYAEHFQAGFEAGYTDICTGGDGYVPATPPEDYWGFEYQTPDGSQCVNSWFEGYPAGVAAAKRDRAGTYRDVYVSRMIQSAIAQEKAPKTTPARVPVVSSKQPTVVPIQQADTEMPVNSKAGYDPSVLAPSYNSVITPATGYDYER